MIVITHCIVQWFSLEDFSASHGLNDPCKIFPLIQTNSCEISLSHHFLEGISSSTSIIIDKKKKKTNHMRNQCCYSWWVISWPPWDSHPKSPWTFHRYSHDIPMNIRSSKNPRDIPTESHADIKFYHHIISHHGEFVSSIPMIHSCLSCDHWPLPGFGVTVPRPWPESLRSSGVTGDLKNGGFSSGIFF